MRLQPLPKASRIFISLTNDHSAVNINQIFFKMIYKSAISNATVVFQDIKY